MQVSLYVDVKLGLSHYRRQQTYGGRDRILGTVFGNQIEALKQAGEIA